MFLSVKYRVETNEGTGLYFEPGQIPLKPELDKIIAGEPFAFSALNEYREGSIKYMGRNRVVCTKVKYTTDGLFMNVSLYLDDLGKGKAR